MRAHIAAVVALALAAMPTAAFAGTATVTDDVGEINSGPEISDIRSATVTYGRKRITIRMTHVAWSWYVGHSRAATGGRITFRKRGSFVILPNANGRRALLYRKKAFLNCPDGKSCTLPCTGWRYDVDAAALTTSVSVPVRCFGFARSPSRVKVLPVHVMPVEGQQPVVDPLDSTGWITRG